MSPREERQSLPIEMRYASAVRTLQDIVAMGKGPGYESARHRLIMLGEPVDSDNAISDNDHAPGGPG